MKMSKNTRKFRLQAKRRQNRRRQVRFNQNVQQLVAYGYPERDARPLVRRMNRVVSQHFPGEGIAVIGVIPVGDQFVEQSVVAPAMIDDSAPEVTAVVATEQPCPVSDSASLVEALSKMIPPPDVEPPSPPAQQLPPPPAFIDVPLEEFVPLTRRQENALIFGEPLILTPGPEAPPEIAPAFCGCANGYRASQRSAVPPAPKKLGFFGRLKQGANDFIVNHSSRRGGRQYRGQ